MSYEFYDTDSVFIPLVTLHINGMMHDFKLFTKTVTLSKKAFETTSWSKLKFLIAIITIYLLLSPKFNMEIHEYGGGQSIHEIIMK